MPIRLLIVEDEAIVRELIRTFAESLELDHEIARTGHEALAATRENVYDLILMDRMMPGMNGLEAAQKIRAEESKNTHTPIIIISGDNDAATITAAMKLGASDFLPKPFEIDDFSAMVKKWTSANAGISAHRSEKNIKQSLAPVDIARLENLSDGTVAGLQETAALYFEEIFELLAKLGDSLAARNATDVAQLAHRGGGLAAFGGMHELSRSLYLINAAGEIGDFTGANKLLKDARQLAESAQTFLASGAKGDT